MITLHRHKSDPKADEIEEAFRNLVLAYQVENLSEKEVNPFIKDGDKEIEGELEIKIWLQELEADLKWQRSLSGDGCYIDPDFGNVC